MSTTSGQEVRPERPGARRFRLGLVTALAILDGLSLASWVPQYLTWPWWADPDAFAGLAQSWEAGILPYRDIAAFNFPGQIYMMWALGKMFGWGRTTPFYALDAGFVVTLGLAMVVWSRRGFGTVLPGLAGYTAFLSYYLNLDYTQVAQRDWQAPFFMVLGLLVAEGWPGRRGRIAAAAAAAIAVTIRPHVVVLLPAMALALHQAAGDRGEPRAVRTARAWGEWGLVFGACLLLAFAPLIVAGVFDDFARGVFRTAHGTQYSRATWSSALGVLVGQFQSARLTVVFLAVCLAALWPGIRSPSPARRAARIWSAAFLGALFYKPIHPVYHDYLDHPIWLVWSIDVAVLVALIVESRRPAPIARSLAIVIISGLAIRGVPSYQSLERSLEAPRRLASGTEPPTPPLGYARRPTLPNAAFYPWRDYRALLAYLRGTTAPSTRVANVLKGFPAVNGPVGRLSPFPVESGLVFVWLMGRTVEEPFADALEQTPDSVVVWIPDEDGPVLIPLDRLGPLIRKLYRPEARFGAIEVWRRKDASR